MVKTYLFWLNVDIYNHARTTVIADCKCMKKDLIFKLAFAFKIYFNQVAFSIKLL